MSTTILGPVAARKAALRMANIERGRDMAHDILLKAEYLPEVNRAILFAHVDRGVSTAELALLNGLSTQQMRRRLDRLKAALADPMFLLAAKYRDKLRPDLQPIAEAYWLEGLSLRDVAQRQRKTLHQVRQQVALVRSLLMVNFSAAHPQARTLALSALDRERN